MQEPTIPSERRPTCGRSPALPEEQREPEHKQEVADDRADERGPDNVRQPIGDRDQRDDQLGRVAERGVEEAADAGARVLRRVVGRLADQPRERDQRGCREREDGQLSGGSEPVQRDDKRPERKQ